MKRKTIISLVLALGLLLMGSIAYGYGNDRGPHGINKDGYGCRYANMDRAAYSARGNAPVARVAMPCRDSWQGKVRWNDKRHGHENRQGFRCFRFLGRCW